ncbi:unnamed protein product [Cyprideis torosa]|uniref:Uncharacterized protein n=1 Tax=Cyprideis torosa TaxID=163714 RepID=A0A7R8WN91_9CRUS|nr:unnamed protein product [Cyprideis torosa]CAG0906011.1 unnamed protein product [Cyprideis torosa]
MSVKFLRPVAIVSQLDYKLGSSQLRFHQFRSKHFKLLQLFLLQNLQASTAMEMLHRIALAFFVVSIATFIDVKARKEEEDPGKFQRVSRIATNVETQFSTIDGRNVSDCSITGTWSIPQYGEVTVSFNCYTDCNPIYALEIPLLSLTHTCKSDTTVALQKDGKQVLIKERGLGDCCDISYEEAHIGDLGTGGYLDEKCGTPSSPPTYTSREHLTEGFLGVSGCGLWTLNVTDHAGGDTGTITALGIRFAS